MDYQTLMNRRGIENEIRQLERDIARKEAEKSAATSVLSHSPRAPGAGSDKVGRIATELVYLRGELGKRVSERDEMLEYISSIGNSTIRTAMRMYFIYGKTWRTVGRVLNYDFGWIRQKVIQYLEKSPQTPQKPM